MLKDEKFNFEIANMKKDFEIENMNVTASDIDMLKKYNNNEINMNDMINSVVKKYNKN